MIHTIHRIFRLSRFSNRLSFWTIIMITFFCGLSILSFVWLDKKDRVNEIEYDLKHTINNQRIIVENWANERMNDVRYLANLPATKQVQLDEMKSIFFQQFERMKGEVESIVFIDRYGRALIDTAAGEDFESSGVQLNDREYFIQAEQNREHMVDVIESRSTGQATIIFSAPVTSPSGKFQGVVFGAAWLSEINDMLSQSIRGESGQIVFINTEGSVMSYLTNRSEVAGQTWPAYYSPRINESHSFDSYVNEFGEGVYGAIGTVFGGRYYLINEIATDEILEPHRRMIRINLLIGLLFLSVSYIIVILLSKGLHRSLSLITKGIKQMQEGDYRIQLDPQPFINAPKETKQIVEVFNKMTINIEKKYQILKEHARIDEVTGIFNRRVFEEYYTKEWHDALNKQHPISLLFIDVDYFKEYNDAFGHQAGDQCLRKISQAIRSTLEKPTHVVMRYGGEEFAIVLSNTYINEAATIAENVRARILSLCIPRNDADEYVTVSIGVAGYVPSEITTKEELIGLADQALYEAKSMGRNNVVSMSYAGSSSKPASEK